jgi:two-component system, NtrC family, nitrogen regulation sensor histidine kinase NtrY
MKLRTKYILFVGILHLVALVLSYFIFSENKILFIVSEVVIFVSIVLSRQLYVGMIRPLKLLMQGTDAIRDRDFNVKFVATGKYEMDKLIDVYNHMMDELRTERTKQEEQHLFLEKLVFTSPTGILVLDYDEKVHQANPKALQLLGLEEKEVLRQSIDGIDHPVMRQIKLLQSGQAKTFTISGAVTFKIQKSHFIDRGFPRHFVMIEELTAEILMAEKKTYGKVIRMMAHEVNNTIGPVNSIIQSTLQSRLHSEMLSNALQVAMERNNNLEHFMRNFADLVRIPAPVKKPVDIIRLVKNVTDLMELRAGEKKVLFRHEHPQPVLVMNADAQQMEQVLINIIKNALEAIEEAGTVTILTRPQPGVQLVIRDTGKGIDPGMEEHLFSPFYSTKKDGQGVGLTIIREILLNHGFNFSLRTLGRGNTGPEADGSPGNTEFVIYF